MTSEEAIKPEAQNLRQPAQIAEECTLKLLSYLGVTNVQWASVFGRRYIRSITVQNVTKEVNFSQKGTDPLEGFIIVNDIDRKGRPISWVFGGDTDLQDGSRVSTNELLAKIKDAVNYRLVANGMVYPYFFMTLSAALRQPLIHAMLNAQRQKMKLWALDQTQSGIPLSRISQLTYDHLICPYLFRRIAKHQFRRQLEAYWKVLKKGDSYRADPEELFLDTFFDDTNPYILLVEERDFRRLDDIMTIRGYTFQLHTHPGNIVFLG